MVIGPGHPDPAGFPRAGEIRIWPDCMRHGGSDFQELQYPVLYQVWCQLRKSADEACRLSPAVSYGASCSSQSGFPLVWRLPINVRALYLWCKRRCCHTLCWHMMLHRNMQIGICQWIIAVWMMRPASGGRWHFIGRPTSSQWYRFTEL